MGFHSNLKSLKHMSVCLNIIVHLSPFLLSKSLKAILRVNQYVTELTPFAADYEKFVLPESPSPRDRST